MTAQDDQAKRREELRKEIASRVRIWFGEPVLAVEEEMNRLFDAYLTAERERVEVEARLDEVALAAHSTADPIKGETWKDWSFRMLEYLEKRKGELQRRKEET